MTVAELPLSRSKGCMLSYSKYLKNQGIVDRKLDCRQFGQIS